MSGNRKVLNIVGAGNVGKALASLWLQQGVFQIGDILNRTTESANRAVEFIGDGRATASLDEMRPADAWLIAVGDDAIRNCCVQLAASGKLFRGTVVFHCSGALSSDELGAARAAGATAASIHPIRSFAKPEEVVANFAGTWCGAEGDADALALLVPAFESIGARVAAIDRTAKTVYHSAAVFACNYLVTLMEAAVKAYGAAGISRDTALQMMEPLVRGTMDNVFRVGPAAALSGPIARGDLATAHRQSAAVHAWNEEYGALYDQFMKLTIELAQARAKQEK